MPFFIDRLHEHFEKRGHWIDGGWQRETDPPGVTAIVLRAFVQDQKFPAKTPFVKTTRPPWDARQRAAVYACLVERLAGCE